MIGDYCATAIGAACEIKVGLCVSLGDSHLRQLAQRPTIADAT
jgi:hypothetical protein